MTTDNNSQYDHDPREEGSEVDKLIRSAKKNISFVLDLLLALIGLMFIVFIIGSI